MLDEKGWKRLLFRVRSDVLINEFPLQVSDLQKLTAHFDDGSLDTFRLLCDMIGIEEKNWEAYVADALLEGEELEADSEKRKIWNSLGPSTMFCKICDHEAEEPEFTNDDYELQCPECGSIKVGKRRE